MNKLFLSAQAYSKLAGLAQRDRSLINQALSQLRRNPELGLRLWGAEDLYLYQTATDLKIVYKLGRGQIQIVGLKPAEEPPHPRDRITAIILAAGEAEYDNIPLQLLPIDGVPSICRVTETFLTAGIDDLIVVLGYHSEQVKKELANKDIKIIVNPEYERGLSKSLRYGLRMVSKDTAAVALALGNRPFVGSGVIERLIAIYRKEKMPIIAPTYHQVRGHPVIFDTRLIPELLRAKGDVGGRKVIQHHRRELREVEVEEAGILRSMENHLS